MDRALREQDLEMVGEVIDCLMAFRVPDTDPLIVKGRTFLLEGQRDDGGWGQDDADDYGYFHTVWTAIDGLRDYKWSRGRTLTRQIRRILGRR
jgi:hypothetical protein